MTPNWLNVDKAIIFFISISFIATIPAISIVDDEIISKKLLNCSYLNSRGVNRNKRKTPAVTKVDE